MSDRRISAEIGLGASTVDDVTARCSAGNDCGRCIPRIEYTLGIRRSNRLTAQAS